MSLDVLLNDVEKIRYLGGRLKLKGFSTFEFTGEDVEQFFQSFSTINVEKLKINSFALSCRLSRSAQIQFYFYLIKSEEGFICAVPNADENTFLSELEKFIISEDVEYSILKDTHLFIYFDPQFLIPGKAIRGTYLGEPCKLIISDSHEPPFTQLKKIPAANIKLLAYLSGWPEGNSAPVMSGAKLVNNSYLNEIAVDYEKGCFLGQETAAKINFNRGAASYPCLVEFESSEVSASPEDIITSSVNDDETPRKLGKVSSVFFYDEKIFATCDLARELRVDQTSKNLFINNKVYKVKIYLYPFFKDINNKLKSKELTEQGQMFFQEENISSALEFLNQAIKLNSHNSEAMESLGVIYGREGDFEKAIMYMDRLEKIDQHNVMANTNKSLYLMKLGRIDEAEDEKAKATVKTFQQLGREAKIKKDEKEEVVKRIAAFEKKKKMFTEVLSIDQEDEIANLGMMDVTIELGEFEFIQTRKSDLMSWFSGVDTFHFLLAKFYQKTGEINNAKESIKKAQELAALKTNQALLGKIQQLNLQIASS